MKVAPTPTMNAEQVALLRQLVESGALGGGVLVTDNLKRDYEELVAKGVVFTDPPTEQPWGFAAIMKDDSGNYFSIGEER
jgi:predicted enzyme related to lactoylglutathione lyase